MRLYIEQIQDKVEEQKKEIEIIEKEKSKLSLQLSIMQEKLYQDQQEKDELKK